MSVALQFLEAIDLKTLLSKMTFEKKKKSLDRLRFPGAKETEVTEVVIAVVAGRRNRGRSYI